MSKTDSLHYKLCVEGGKWLKRSKRNYERCKTKPCHVPELCRVCTKHRVVAVELVTLTAENCDVWGYDGWNTTVIEVKTSHSDFMHDMKKAARNIEVQYQLGNLRWYLCPEWIIKKEELPEGWGLLYWDGKKIMPIVAPVRREGCTADLRMLYSIMLREGMCDKIYNYRGAPSTIKPQTINGMPAEEYHKKKKGVGYESVDVESQGLFEFKEEHTVFSDNI